MDGETVVLPTSEPLDLLAQDLSLDTTTELIRQDSPTHQDVRESVDSSEIIDSNKPKAEDLTLSGKSSSFSKLAPAKTSTSNQKSGQVVNLPPIADGGKSKSSKGVLLPNNGSTKLMSKTSTNNNNPNNQSSATATTQATLYSNQQQKSSNSSISRSTFPSDASPPVGNAAMVVKSRQASISRSSMSSTNSSNTGPLPEMRVASMKMQMVQKKVPPKSVSVVSLGNNYRYKVTSIYFDVFFLMLYPYVIPILNLRCVLYRSCLGTTRVS